MKQKIILLLQLLVLVATATLEEEIAGQEESELALRQIEPSDCQFQVIKSCNHQFKSLFEKSAGEPDLEVYCNGMQSFMTCLETSSCSGPFLDDYTYVVLQHGMMDKKLNLCPDHVYTTLRTKVQATTKHRAIDIGADSSAECSVLVHKKCVLIFTKNMETNSNMCQDVQSFLDCYKKESPTCKAEITQDFAQLCNQLGEEMLKASEKHRGMMC